MAAARADSKAARRNSSDALAAMAIRVGPAHHGVGGEPVHSRRDLLIGAALAAALLGGAGLASAEPSADMIAKAKAEGQVVWNTGMIIKQVVIPLVDGFKAKYGIDVQYVESGDSANVLKLTSQAQAGKMEIDLFDSPGTSIPPLSAAGLIEPFVPDSMAKYPAMFRPASKLYSGIYALYLTTNYNTDLVKADEAPKTYQDLLDPKWKGKMVWTDTRGISGPPGFIGNILMTMGDEKGMAYLKELSKQGIVRDPGNQRVVINKVISGEFPIGLMTYNHHSVISQGKGAPVAWVKMEPLVANLGVIAVVKNAPHPNAAKLFLEFMFSDEGQTIIAAAGYPPGDPDVPAKNPSISPATGGFKTTLLTPEMSSQAAEPLKTWLKIYDELFK